MIWSLQSVRGNDCVCDLKNSDPAFPEQKLTKVETVSAQCIGSITSERVFFFTYFLLMLAVFQINCKLIVTN